MKNLHFNLFTILSTAILLSSCSAPENRQKKPTDDIVTDTMQLTPINAEVKPVTINIENEQIGQKEISAQDLNIEIDQASNTITENTIVEKTVTEVALPSSTEVDYKIEEAANLVKSTELASGNLVDAKFEDVKKTEIKSEDVVLSTPDQATKNNTQDSITISDRIKNINSELEQYNNKQKSSDKNNMSADAKTEEVEVSVIEDASSKISSIEVLKPEVTKPEVIKTQTKEEAIKTEVKVEQPIAKTLKNSDSNQKSLTNENKTEIITVPVQGLTIISGDTTTKKTEVKPDITPDNKPDTKTDINTEIKAETITSEPQASIINSAASAKSEIGSANNSNSIADEVEVLINDEPKTDIVKTTQNDANSIKPAAEQMPAITESKTVDAMPAIPVSEPAFIAQNSAQSEAINTEFAQPKAITFNQPVDLNKKATDITKLADAPKPNIDGEYVSATGEVCSSKNGVVNGGIERVITCKSNDGKTREYRDLR